MSTFQRTFIRWLAGIAAALIVSGIIGIVSLYGIVNTTVEKVNNNRVHIQSVRTDHKNDTDLIRQEMWDMRADQKIIMSDIKEILKEMSNN